MSKFKRTSAKGAFWCLAMWLAGLCISAPAYSAVCFLPGDTGKCGMAFEDDDQDKETPDACDGKTTITPQEFSEKYDSNCYTYTAGEKNGQTVYCDIKVSESDGYKLDSQKHCCPNGTAWDSKSNECCTGGKCPVVCDSDLYIVENDVCVCKNGKAADGSCCPDYTHGSNGICCPSGEEGKEDGASLICCPEGYDNKGGTCVSETVGKTCSQISDNYKESCPPAYTKEEAKDEYGKPVKNYNGTQCYICERPNGKNPLVVRLRLTCDGKTCPDVIYNGDYMFYYAGLKEHQTGTRDVNNDIIITIPDWKRADFDEGNDYRVGIDVIGKLATVEYTNGFNGSLYRSLAKNNTSILRLSDGKLMDKDESGVKELIMLLDLRKGELNPGLGYTFFAKVKCTGPYEDIKAEKAVPQAKWGDPSTDNVCPIRRIDGTDNVGYSGYFAGLRYSETYAEDATQCATYQLIIEKDGIIRKQQIDPNRDEFKVNKDASELSVGLSDGISVADFKKEVDISKLRDDEELIHINVAVPTGDSFYTGAKYSLRVTPKVYSKGVYKPSDGWSGRMYEYEYAFVDEDKKISSKKSQTIELKLDDNALYTYINSIEPMYPVIRLKAVVEKLTTKDVSPNISYQGTSPIVYKYFRNLSISDLVYVENMSDTYWKHTKYFLTPSDVVNCKDSELNVYVAASRNILSPINTSLSSSNEFGAINANIYMKKGDIIAYPENNPWCLNVAVNEATCKQAGGDCTDHPDGKTCKEWLDKCLPGVNTPVVEFLAMNATNLANPVSRRMVHDGPERSGYLHTDGAIYIFESGFNISEDGTTGSTNPGDSDYDACYKKTCEDFGLYSNSQPGSKCYDAKPGCGLSCKRCGFDACYEDFDTCSQGIEEVYWPYPRDGKQVICTTPENDNEDIKTVCDRIAKKDIEDGGQQLDGTETYSSLSEFVEYFPNPNDQTSAKKCAVCVYTY